MSSPTSPERLAEGATVAAVAAAPPEPSPEPPPELVIAVQPDFAELPGYGRRFSDRWIRGIEEAGHRVRVVDVFRSDVMRQLEGCEALMWRVSIHPDELSLARRVLPVVEQYLGIPVYPSWSTLWHYDDKVAQALLFEAADIPAPTTRLFWRRDEAEEFAAGAAYPQVLKLAAGASSANVRLVASADEARQWIGLLFGPGAYTLRPPKRRGLRAVRRRVRPAIGWLIAGRLPDPGEFWRLEKNYVLFQEFLPGNEFDTRVTVVGNRAYAFRRFNRPGDFRASGSGRFDLDPAPIDPTFVRLAFQVAEVLQMESVAIDGLYDDGRAVVAEVSYTFVASHVPRCPGRWILDGDAARGTIRWRDGSSYPQDAILEDFLARLGAKRRAAART